MILRGTTKLALVEKVIMMNSERKTMGDYEDSCWLDKEFEPHFRTMKKPLEDFNQGSDLNWFMFLKDLSVH